MVGESGGRRWAVGGDFARVMDIWDALAFERIRLVRLYERTDRIHVFRASVS